jgi:GMP synthase-like glutamine amidotransferase
MNILIVDGNEKKASDRYTQLQMPTQYEVYKQVLENLSNAKLNITTIHPACTSEYLIDGVNLDDFVGIVWTGSLLNIYDYGASIERQIELAKILLNKKNKIFGSCWGLQVLATAAGGSIRKNPQGLEAVIANNITLNEKGIHHPMYKNKPNQFDSFCWHYDEVETLPENTVILSSNNKSEVQSFTFHRSNSEVWAVQYHPEFNSKWISGLMNQRKQLLLEENVFTSSKEFEKLYSYLSDIKKFNHLKKELSISDSLVLENIHTTELYNWLEYIKNDI